MTSCAAWLSWKCQMSAGAAREHVRVARALRDLPVIRAEFGAGRLSYAKVRALTRIATPENEAGLAGQPAAGQPAAQTSSSLADALLDIAEAFLAGKVAGADDSEVDQGGVHGGTDALNSGPGEHVSAEAPAAAGLR